MNCLEVRRAILVDPQKLSGELLSHLETCNACAAFKEEQLIFEQQLSDTMSITPPEGLASRILLAQSTGQIQTQKRQHRFLAIAASFILAIGVMIAVQINPFSQSVDQLVLAHVNNEVNHLNDKLNVSDAKIQTIFKELNMKVSSPLGQVNFAGNCEMRNKQKGAHLVLQGKNGPVTVLIMPAEQVASKRKISDPRFHGVIVPATRGSFAVVAERNEILEPYVQQLGQVIKM